MSLCSVCQSPLGHPVFESEHALTSMGTPASWPIRVRFCATCSHIATDAPEDESRYYADSYHLCDEAEGEDQVYDDGSSVLTRTGQQLRLLQDTTLFPKAARVLSLGAAKGATLRALCEQRLDLEPYVFDVTERYRTHWNAWVPAAQQAVGEMPTNWHGTMHVVQMLFVAEHVSDLHALGQMALRALRPGGQLRLLVPDVFGNPGDLVVADHVQHFTHASLSNWLHAAGFSEVSIDAEAQVGALYATATAPESAGASVPVATTTGTPADIDGVRARLIALAAYWTNFEARVREAESRSQGELAIFGAGFYGRMIALALREPSRLVAFVDSNPWLQTRLVHERPVLSPEAVPPVSAVFVGLNPVRARAIASRVPALHRRGLSVVFP